MVLVVGQQIVSVDPTPVALPVAVAPGPVIGTSIHVDVRVGWHGSDQRVFTTRPRTHVHEALGIGAACGCQQREGHANEAGQNEDENAKPHDTIPLFSPHPSKFRVQVTRRSIRKLRRGIYARFGLLCDNRDRRIGTRAQVKNFIT